MRRSLKAKSLIIVILTGLAVLPLVLLAAWIAGGTPICTAPNAQYGSTIAYAWSHGIIDGAIVTWGDFRNGSHDDIWAQRVNGDGDEQWSTDGVPVCTSTGNQSYPAIATDKENGAIIAWEDERSGPTNSDIYAQRILSTDAPDWTTNGVVVCNAAGDQSDVVVIADGYYGAIVMWIDKRTDPDGDIYVQRLDDTGAPMWPANGVAVCTASGVQVDPVIAPIGTLGFIIAWVDHRAGPYSNLADIYAQRVSLTGVTQWDDDGIPICAAAMDQVGPAIVGDRFRNAIIAWRDHRNDTGSPEGDIFAQRVGPSGDAQWTPDGFAVWQGPAEDLDPELTIDGSDNAVVVWPGIHNGLYTDLYLAIVDGVSTPTTRPVCTAQFSQGQQAVVSDGAGGAVISWIDSRAAFGTFAIYAQRYNNGEFLWDPDGILITGGLANNRNLRMVTDGAHGAITSWDRAGDIYAQRAYGEDCGLSVSSLDFGMVSVGDWQEEQFTITNTGEGSVLEGSVWESCPHYQIMSGGGAYSLNPSEYVDVVVRFEPTESGTHACDIQTGNVLCGAVPCTGNGMGCDVDPIDIDFGLIATGEYVDETFTIYNLLSSTLTGDISETCGAFSILSGGGPFSLGPGEFLVVTVRFGPAPSGQYDCTVDTGEEFCYDVSLTGQVCATQPRLYVDEDAIGSGDGTSWANAYTELREALAAVDLCPGITEIWVAEGTYTPTELPDTLARFELKNNLSIYGGFNGTESTLGERDVSAHPTILSGEVGAPGQIDNCHNVVYAFNVDATAVLDGFTVTGAYNPNGNGGGMVVEGGTPTISNVTFEANEAQYGGGMYLEVANAILLQRLTFDSNVASYWGGGLYANRCTTATFTNMLFCDNNAGAKGGGYYQYLSPGTVLSTVAFCDNVADNGGAVGILKSTASLTNVSMCANTGNVAGGGLYFDIGGGGDVTNSILWGDTAPVGNEVFYEMFLLGVPFSYSLIENCGGSGAGWDTDIGIDGGNNIEGDPLFYYPWDGDLRIGAGSPAIEAGDGTAAHLTSTDLDGEARVIGAAPDMGAYEYATPTGVGGDEDPTVPDAFALYQNVPNPFNPTTTIAYDVPAGGGRVRLDIFDVSGRLVRILVDGTQTEGVKRASWDGRNNQGAVVASGVYFCRMTAPEFTQTRKMVLLR
ncbi:MAG: choice-of-anchor D domain-containing protein [Candidatus Latescibacteria bacterium]|nr:choice-of-anchor D domain-containing protein [Candidatus Latescibacterota bacterium]NIO55297.1 choice-of-anchor D domain-containing protein [Candidatus Latescibacterota bacterium]